MAVNSSDVGLAWILSDHLGSTSKVIRASDYATRSETRYKPFGQARYVDGVSPTSRGFTGQIEPGLEIVFFQSCSYDSYLPALQQRAQGSLLEWGILVHENTVPINPIRTPPDPI